MQYRINTAQQTPDLPSIELALQRVDAAASIDPDQCGDQLRVSTIRTTVELVEVVDRSGYPITIDRVVLQPSECCGGCGG